MADDDYGPIFKQDYSKLTPAQIKRQRDFAYAIMKDTGQPSRSWASPIGDVLKVLAGQHMLQQTGEGDYEARELAGQRRNQTLNDARSLVNRPSQDQLSEKNKVGGITTSSISPSDQTNTPPKGDIGTVNSEQSGFDTPTFLKRLTGPESANGTNTSPNKYGYGGHFGMRPGEYGLTKEDFGNSPAQKEKQIRAAKAKTEDNVREFTEKYGRTPTLEEAHLMHNQGVSGAFAHMDADPEMPAWVALQTNNPKLSDQVAKLRIKEQIPRTSPLAKVPVDDITTGQFQSYMADRFNGGWKDATTWKYNPPMRLLPEGEVNPKAPNGQQIAQNNNLPGVPPPRPLRSPIPDSPELSKFFADPRIDDKTKDLVHERIMKAATPNERDVVGGKQENYPGAPEGEQRLRGAADSGTMSIGNMNVPYTTFRDPSGKTETLFNIPGRGLGTIEDLKEWSRREASKDESKLLQTKEYEEEYNKFQQVGSSSQDQIKNLDLMKETLNDPNMYTGTGDQRVLDWKKFLVAAGKDPNDRAAPAEVFKKLMAGGVLEGLGQFKGLGQIRVAEIEQLQKSLADTNMTKPAITAVLNLNQKAHQRHVDIANLASEYAAEHDGKLDRGWDKYLREWKQKNPFMKPEQIKNWKEEFAGRPATIEKKVEPKPTNSDEWEDLGDNIKRRKVK